MGRKTWESIPFKVRPLNGRINVVVSREPERLDLASGAGRGEGEVLGVKNLENGITELASRYGGDMEGDKVGLGRVFVIGGAEIYKQALLLRNCERILWTRLGREWECDVFFPSGVLPAGERDTTATATATRAGEGGGSRTEATDLGNWARSNTQKMESWTGEDDSGGLRKEGEVEFEVCMLEKRGS